MAQEYNIEKSDLIVLVGEDGNSWADVWAIFDVSPDIYRRFIACHWSKHHPNEKIDSTGILTIFDNLQDLLYWCASLQMDNDVEFRGGMDSKFNDHEWLDEECQNDGWENWKAFVENAEIIHLQRQEEVLNDIPFTAINDDEQILYDNIQRCPSCGSFSDGPKHVYCDNCGSDWPAASGV